MVDIVSCAEAPNLSILSEIFATLLESYMERLESAGIPDQPQFREIQFLATKLMKGDVVTLVKSLQDC